MERSRIAILIVATAAGCHGGVPATPDLGTSMALEKRDCSTTISFTPDHKPTKIGVGGDWNAFQPDQTTMTGPDGTGAYRATLQLDPGVYAYKIVVYDGTTPTWVLDPNSPYSKFVQGVENSALEVGDCSLPQLRFERLDHSPDGNVSGAVKYIDGAKGDGIGAVTVTLDGQPMMVTPDANGDIAIAASGLAKNKHRIVVSATDASGRAAEDLHIPFWVEDETFDFRDGLLYFAFTDRFLDGDPSNDSPSSNVDARANYEGGDFSGIRQKIEAGYFDTLGVRSIWVSPPNANPDDGWIGADGRQYSGYHGYWPTAGRTTQSRFGSVDDMKAMVKSAHARGIRIIVDTVLNHVHVDHPYYQQHKTDGWFNGDGSCVCGAPGCDWDTYRLVCWFTSYLPDMNYQNWDATEAMIGDALFWARDIDVDGFRVDAVKHFELAATRRLRGRLRDLFEHAGSLYYLVGETFTGNSDGERQYIQSFIGPNALEAQFDFPIYWAVTSALATYSGTMRDLESTANASDAVFGEQPMSPFFGNHDVARFLTTAAIMLTGDGKDQAWTSPPAAPSDSAGYYKLQNALTFLATQPGVPLLYYGDEFGMPGAADPDNRRMMKWDGYSADEAATLAHAQKAGQARRELRALRRGKRTTAWVDDDLYVYARFIDATPGANAEVALVGINRSWNPQSESVPVPPNVPLADGTVLTDRISGTKITVTDGHIPVALDPHSSAIWAP
jgi:glycosidase